MTNGWLLPTILVVVCAAIVAALALRKRMRRNAMVRVAKALGLRYSAGDPLGLSQGLGADVSDTIWGRFEGADIAIATASRSIVRPDSESWVTSSVGVSLKVKVVRGLEIAQRAAGPSAQVGLTTDGRLAVRSRVPNQRSAAPVVQPDDLPTLLEATARAARSQSW